MKATPRDRRIAVALTLILVAIFHLDGGFLPGNDAKPSLYAVATLLAEGRMSFAPQTEPFMFTWEVEGPTGPRAGSLVNWTSPINGEAPADLYAAGRLRLKAPKYFIVEDRSHAFVSSYGPSTPLVALPFFAVLHAAVGDLREHSDVLWYGGKAFAALLTAISAALVFLSARSLALDERKSVVVALVFGLATCAWSVLSQTLWQQATDSFFLALGAFLFIRAPVTAAKGSRLLYVLCGFAFAMAAACRPTCFAALAVVSAYLLIVRRHAVVAFAAGAFFPAVAMLAYNAHAFGSPFVFGQLLVLKQGGRELSTVPFEGLPGMLISPGRGLFVYSPVLAFAIFGAVRAWRQRADAQWSAIRVLTGVAAVMILAEAFPFEWWGGWSFGYRRIADSMPLLVLGLVPVTDDVMRRRALRAAFVATFVWSVFVQALGAMAYDLDGWNARKENGVSLNIDKKEFRGRLWSVSDSPLVYYVTHYSEARAHRKEWIANWLRRPTA